MDTAITVVLIGIPLLVAVTFHEVAHGWIAEKLGDPTARSMGRITLNPIRHIDLYMTIFLPIIIYSLSGFVFGGAKPVPVQPAYFKDPRRGMMWVALAGPVINFVLALLSYLLLLLLGAVYTMGLLPELAVGLLFQLLVNSVFINVLLGVFNLLPIPPLDGGRIAVGLLPESLAYKYAQIERYGLLMVIALVYLEVPSMVLGPIFELVNSLMKAGLS